MLSRVKLIAEPWDAADGGYQLGAYLPGWSEWNDRFRDTVRSFWLQPDKNRGAFASQLAGASEQFHHDGRNPQASINFITSHDGFTLNDLVSYNGKHNEANGEDNRDGNNNNLSWNAGAEGPTGDAGINRTRNRLKRSLLGSLMLAQGVPMLTAGDEMGRTQRGNNNAYNQDNEISWLDWEQADPQLLDYTAHLAQLRRDHPQLRLPSWLLGAPTASGLLDVRWLNANGEEMQTNDWPEHGSGVFGQYLGAHDEHEQDLLILFNPDIASHHFVLPEGEWVLVLDGDQPDGRPQRAASADSQIDEAMTQIMHLGLPLSPSSRTSAPPPLQPPVAAPRQPAAAVTPRRPSHLLQAHCLYLFVARRKPK